MAFDPDAYLVSKATPTQGGGFDPDAYLASKAPDAKPYEIGSQAGFASALRETMREAGPVARNLAGAGTAVRNLWEGGKQMLGMGDPQAIQAQRILAEEAPGGALAGNLALLAPTMFIPGANTVAGAGVVGGVNGLLQPTVGEESRIKNTAGGAILGMVGQAGGNKLGQAIQKRGAAKAAEAAANQSRNSVKDATLAQSRAAGYVVPNSEVAPSFIGNRLESLAGKAATKQEATLRNQETTNALARKSLGMADDAPIDQNALDAIRKAAGQAYEDVARLSPQAKADLEALKQARFDAKAQFNFYNRSADPDALAKAKAFRATAEQLEQSLESAAQAAGRADLLPALANARKTIAKSYTVERALNQATGDVSAPVISRIFAKGQPLSDGLEAIGGFGTAFPKFAGNAANTPAAGVSKSEAIMAGLLGGGGALATGSPLGMVMGAAPLLSGPARALALSKMLEKSPGYGVGLSTKLMEKLTPDRAALMSRALLQTGALPSAALSAQ